MKYDLFKECVGTLRVLSARMHEELDAGVTTELDDVIQRLERCLETANDEVMIDVELRMRTLETISKCLTAATNLAEIIRKLFSPE